MRVYFAVVESLVMQLLVQILLIDRFFKGSFLKDRRLVPIRSRPVATSSEYTLPLDLPAALQTCWDANINTQDWQDKDHRSPLWRVGKCVNIQPNAKAPL